MFDRTLIIGDLHFRQKLGYADHIADGRVAEEKEILDFIFSKAEGCDKVVFLGDQLDARNNPSEVIKKFVNFVERFNDGKRQVFILLGNHDKMPDGKSAIDFYKEIEDPNLHIITNKVEKFDNMVFCPYFYKGELGSKNYVQASKTLMKMLPEADILFIHQTVSDLNIKGISSNTFNEIILQRKDLKKKFKRVIAGHIHLPSNDDFVTVAGSIFNQEVGEDGKYIYIRDKDLGFETIPLPGRKIIKLNNPTHQEIELLDKNSIVKVILDKQISKEKIEEMKKLLEKNTESFVLIEEFKHQRKKVEIKVGKLDFSILNLLEMYATQKKIDLVKLNKGFELIRG